MSKESLFSLTIVLAILGVSVTAGHPAWGGFTGAAILLLAGGIATGAVKARSQYENRIVERGVTGQKISSGLVTLSSAAIFAVYAAGYHRTGPAADRIAEQAARRKTAAIVAAAVAPQAALPQVAVPSAVLTPPPKPAHPRASSAKVPKAVHAPAADSPDAPDATPADNSAADTAAPPAAPRKVRYKNGTYLGWGRSYHGDIQASVVIAGGQIASATIAQCLTRYPCSWIAQLPGQVLTRQSANVDYVSGATESSDAFYDAIVSALSQASE